MYSATHVITPYNLTTPVAMQLCRERYPDSTHAQLFVLGCLIQCSNGTPIVGDDESVAEGVISMPDSSYGSLDDSMVCYGGQCCLDGECHENNGMEGEEIYLKIGL